MDQIVKGQLLGGATGIFLGAFVVSLMPAFLLMAIAFAFAARENLRKP